MGSGNQAFPLLSSGVCLGLYVFKETRVLCACGFLCVQVCVALWDMQEQWGCEVAAVLG